MHWSKLIAVLIVDLSLAIVAHIPDSGPQHHGQNYSAVPAALNPHPTGSEIPPSLDTLPPHHSEQLRGRRKTFLRPSFKAEDAPINAKLSKLNTDRSTISTAISYTNSVIHGDFPDPGVLYNPYDHRYWVATTSGDNPDAYAIHSSSNLINWTAKGYVFPQASAGRPAWAVSDFWAPELHLVGEKHVVYFAARNRNGMLSVGAAVSSNDIAGPYIDIGHELVTSLRFGMIDPTFFYDNGTNYLIWKEDANDPAHCPSRKCPTQIYLSPLDSTGTKLLLPEGRWVVLLNQTQAWEGPLVEAPWIIRTNAYYYLFYSGNGYNSPSYALGVARARALQGPWEKNPRNPIVMTGLGSFYGPGHCSVMSDGTGEWWYVYHAWNKDGSGRNVMLDKVVFGSDHWPVRSSPSTSPGPGPAPRPGRGLKKGN